MNGLIVVLDDDLATRNCLLRIGRNNGLHTLSFSEEEAFNDWAASNFRHLSLSDSPSCAVINIKFATTSFLSAHDTSIENYPIIYTGEAVPIGAMPVATGSIHPMFLPMPFKVDAARRAILNGLNQFREVAQRRAEINCAKQKISRLTRRENEVACELEKGRSCKDIAELLKISTKTVHVHRSRLLQKLAINSVAGITGIRMLASESNSTRSIASLIT